MPPNTATSRFTSSRTPCSTAKRSGSTARSVWRRDDGRICLALESSGMNFDFSDEQKQLRDTARKFLAEKCPPKAVRAVIDGKAPYDRDLWKGLAEMGFLGFA